MPKVIYNDPQHIKHREATRRYRGRLKYGAKVPKFVLRTDVAKAKEKERGWSPVTTSVLAEISLDGYYRIRSHRHGLRHPLYCPRKNTRLKLCNALGLEHHELWERV